MKIRHLLIGIVFVTQIASPWSVTSHHEALAYNEVGHFYTAVAVAHDVIQNFPGTSRRDAVLIAYCAQVPDLTDDFDAVALWLKVNVYPAGFFRGGPLLWGAFSTCANDDVRHMAAVHQYLHALTDSKADLVSQAASQMIDNLRRNANGDANKLCAAGFGVHLLGDSYAHRRLSRDTDLYAAGVGHGFDGTKPDQLSFSNSKGDRVPLWLNYMDGLAEPIGGKKPPPSRATLEQLAKKNLTDGSPARDRTAKTNLIQGLRLLLAPDNQVPTWAPYKIEDLSRGTFENAVKPIDTLGKPTRDGVWSAYMAAALPAFSSRNISTKCTPKVGSAP